MFYRDLPHSTNPIGAFRFATCEGGSLTMLWPNQLVNVNAAFATSDARCWIEIYQRVQPLVKDMNEIVEFTNDNKLTSTIRSILSDRWHTLEIRLTNILAIHVGGDIFEWIMDNIEPFEE